MMAMGMWTKERMDNRLDGGAHYYGSYACADGKFISIGSIEPQFYALLLELCEIDDPEFAKQNDKQHWASLRGKLEALFITQPRDHWCALLEGTDVCFAPVLDLQEASTASHSRHRRHALAVRLHLYKRRQPSQANTVKQYLTTGDLTAAKSPLSSKVGLFSAHST